MFGIGIPELIIIVLAFGLLFFGSKKVLEFSRGLGKVSGEYKKGKLEIERELREAEEAAKRPVQSAQQNPPSA